MLPELLLITNELEQASAWDAAGVDIIFVDLEIDGKYERQGHLNTVISKHKIEDVSSVKSVLSGSRLLVRVNPFSSETQSEVDEVIDRGADIIMLPMFENAEEVESTVDMIAGRCDIYPLIETPQALNNIDKLAKIDAVSGYHFGLNDLHMAFNMKFMFEVMALVEFNNAISVLKTHNKKYGIGGVARMGQGILPAELIIRENYRLGSQRMILSRSFKSQLPPEHYANEVRLIKQTYTDAINVDLEKNKMKFAKVVKEIAGNY